MKPPRFSDARGYFSETFRASTYGENGVHGPFVQDNHSVSDAPFVLRGLHFQIGAAAQAKLVRCTRGAIFDVAVDIRRGSPTFGAYVSAELSEDNGHQLYVPIGFAHGFCTLTPACEVQYKVTAYYDRESDKGLAWNDPSIGIRWPLEGRQPILSDKDAGLPPFSQMPDYFKYSET